MVSCMVVWMVAETAEQMVDIKVAWMVASLDIFEVVRLVAWKASVKDGQMAVQKAG